MCNIVYYQRAPGATIVTCGVYGDHEYVNEIQTYKHKMTHVQTYDNNVKHIRHTCTTSTTHGCSYFKDAIVIMCCTTLYITLNYIIFGIV